jgi:hypothetical protein
MEQFTVNVPVRDVDAEDVKNAFADAYGYKDTIDLGNGVSYPNPVTKEQFVTECCTSFLLSILKGYMVENAEAIAVSTASQEASARAAENVALFDAARLAALPVDPFTNHPTAADQNVTLSLNDSLIVTLEGTDPDGISIDFEVVTNPSNGVVELLGGQATYTPNTDFVGVDLFTFKAFNGTKYSPVATVNIEVVNPGE